MSIVVTGSLAFDRIAVFPDRFSKHLLPGKMHQLSVCFTLNELRVDFGGTAGNIAYNLGLLGEKPLVLAAAGEGFDDYARHLEKAGADLTHVKRIKGVRTAEATIITDLDDNQITAFYEGAMAHAKEASFEAVEGPVEAAIIAPNDPKAMLEYAQVCRDKAFPFVADPGQAIPRFSPDELNELLDGAAFVVANDYEWQLIKEKTGLTEKSVLAKAEALVVTYGDQGMDWITKGGTERIPPYPAKAVVDPTGAGDALRAGLLYGIKNNLTVREALETGARLAAACVAFRGTQNH